VVLQYLPGYLLSVCEEKVKPISTQIGIVAFDEMPDIYSAAGEMSLSRQ
jgi:hypothetical protein